MLPKESKHVLLNALMQTETQERFYICDPCMCLIAVMVKAQEVWIHGTNCILAHSRLKCFCFEEKPDNAVLASVGTRLVGFASSLVVPLQWGLADFSDLQKHTHTAAAVATMISHGVSFLPPCVYQLTLRTWEREAEKIQGD